MQTLMGYSVYSGTATDCASEMVAVAKNGARNCQVMACLNPHSYVVARDDARFSTSLKKADWLIPDGGGIVMAAKILGPRLQGRVTGPDVFMEVIQQLNTIGGSIFFLGSSDETLSLMRDRILNEYPNIVLAGTYSPPFKSEFSEGENAEMVKAVNATSPDMLWVGMTAPKQEKWIETNRDSLNVGIASAVGAAFDFFAGTVKRSPLFIQKIGLEWLHRSLTSPRRLGKRNFISNPKFIVAVLRMKMSGGSEI